MMYYEAKTRIGDSGEKMTKYLEWVKDNIFRVAYILEHARGTLSL